jgi:hypothetical protein
MGLLAALAAGFELGGVEEPGRAPPTMIGAALKPANEGEGYGATIRRREGWEDVVWAFTASAA